MNKELLVVKYGTSSVTDGAGRMDVERIEGYVAQLAELHASNDLIVVSSGSIAMGKAFWDELNEGSDYPSEQPLAMLGSAGSFMVWQEAFQRHGIAAGQLPVSHREIDDPVEGTMLKRVLGWCIDARIVPVVNENDAVSDEEIKRLSYGGDNDGLASHIAITTGAHTLLLMTDKEGVLGADKELIPTVDEVNIAQVRLVARSSSGKGKGGMREKVKAAKNAADKGIQAFIGNADALIADILARRTGTYFMPGAGYQENIVE